MTAVRVHSAWVHEAIRQEINEQRARRTAFGRDQGAARTARGVGQTALAEAVGCGRPAVSRWENGDRTPRLEHLAAIARALKLSSTEISEMVMACRAPAGEGRGER